MKERGNYDLAGTGQDRRIVLVSEFGSLGVLMPYLVIRLFGYYHYHEHDQRFFVSSREFSQIVLLQTPEKKVNVCHLTFEQ